MFISLFNFRFLRNCREIEPCQTSNMELYTKVVTFLTKPLPTRQIYVCGIFMEHSLEISTVYSGKIPNEILGNIPKWWSRNIEYRNIPWQFYEHPTNDTHFFWWIKKSNSGFLYWIRLLLIFAECLWKSNIFMDV